MVADPENIGDLLRRTLSKHPGKLRNYQDYPAWRHLTAAYIGEIAAQTGGHVIVSVTVLNPAYAAEMFAPLRASTGLIHLVLHADPKELGARIGSSEKFPCDEAGSEAVRVYRRRRAPDYAAAAAAWMHADGHAIDTNAPPALAVLQAAIAHLTTVDGARPDPDDQRHDPHQPPAGNPAQPHGHGTDRPLRRRLPDPVPAGGPRHRRDRLRGRPAPRSALGHRRQRGLHPQRRPVPPGRTRPGHHRLRQGRTRPARPRPRHHRRSGLASGGHPRRPRPPHQPSTGHPRRTAARHPGGGPAHPAVRPSSKPSTRRSYQYRSAATPTAGSAPSTRERSARTS
ncbi:hypothetical protein OG386_02490 [Streptomyces sp. NBC_00273]|nr:hypothetical protein [Streptomyces sp. NBC_00273]